MKRRKSDGGEAIAIMMIMSLLFLFMTAAVAVDVGARLYVSNTVQTRAQAAVRAATQAQNADGGLTANSANVAANEYIRQRTGAGNASVGIRAMQQTCPNQASYPRITITYDTGRFARMAAPSSPRVTFVGASGNTANETGRTNNHQFGQVRYTTITIEVVDIAASSFFGGFVNRTTCRTVSALASATVVGARGHE